MKTFHICWLIGKDEQGLDLSTGITINADSMLEALVAFQQTNDVEPIYILEK